MRQLTFQQVDDIVNTAAKEHRVYYYGDLRVYIRLSELDNTMMDINFKYMDNITVEFFDGFNYVHYHAGQNIGESQKLIDNPLQTHLWEFPTVSYEQRQIMRNNYLVELLPQLQQKLVDTEAELDYLQELLLRRTSNQVSK